jgi:hypothetical protein
MAVLHTAPQTPDTATRHEVPDHTSWQAPPATPIVPVLARLTWILFGPFVLLVSTLVLLGKGSGFPSSADFTYLAALGAMVVGRWVEFRTGSAQTATGEAATGRHLRRYLMWAGALGLVVWGVTAVVRTCW